MNRVFRSFFVERKFILKLILAMGYAVARVTQADEVVKAVVTTEGARPDMVNVERLCAVAQSASAAVTLINGSSDCGWYFRT